MRKAVLTRGCLALSLALVLAACGSAVQAPQAAETASVSEPALSEQGAVGQERLRALKIKLLKQAILSVSGAARGRCDGDDNYPEVAAVLNRLTTELVGLAPQGTESDRLPRVAGGWKQVWADLGSSSPLCISATDIYQVVSPQGYYWNISKNILPSGQEALGLLRGKYSVTPDFLAIEFTRLAFSPVLPPSGTNLIELANRAEAGAFPALPPNFPVGLRGQLKNAYVDDTLRIVTGRDERPGAPSSIFVLVRASVFD
jgi:hypothetical protein